MVDKLEACVRHVWHNRGPETKESKLRPPENIQRESGKHRRQTTGWYHFHISKRLLKKNCLSWRALRFVSVGRNAQSCKHFPIISLLIFFQYILAPMTQLLRTIAWEHEWCSYCVRGQKAHKFISGPWCLRGTSEGITGSDTTRMFRTIDEKPKARRMFRTITREHYYAFVMFVNGKWISKIGSWVLARNSVGINVNGKCVSKIRTLLVA
jgi:hypothetical protein